MKRLYFLVFILIFVFCSCGNPQSESEPPSVTETDADTETETETEIETESMTERESTTVIESETESESETEATADKEQADYAEKLISELRTKLWNPVYDENTLAESKYVGAVDISLYYKNLETGFALSYRSDFSRPSASVVKAPFALSILEKAQAERADNTDNGIYGEYGLNHPYTYTAADYVVGTGAIQYMPEGSQFTNLSLMELMITDSDCIALSQLTKYYHFGDINELADRLGLNGMYKTTANMSCRDGAKIMDEVYSFYKSGALYGNMLFDWMSRSEERIVSHAALGDDVVIAHKYGHDIDGMHDMALVMRDGPYSLTIMTNYVLVSDRVYHYLYDIVRTVDKINEYAALLSQTGDIERNLK